MPSGHAEYGAEAVSSGNNVYIRLESFFYQLVWNTTAFSWKKQQRELNDASGGRPVMMVLPDEYSCMGKPLVLLLGAK